MFTTIKTYNGENRQAFKDWINKINQAYRASGCNFRSEIIKKLTGVVYQVVMACDGMSDDDLLTSLRTSFSDAPTINQTQRLEELEARENKSIAWYTSTNGDVP